MLEQRGYVSSYILAEGQGDWLERLRRKSNDFDHWLGEARKTARKNAERELLDRLEVVQHAYAETRDTVLKLYDTGQKEETRRILLVDVVELCDQSYDLCEEFIGINQRIVAETSV